MNSLHTSVGRRLNFRNEVKRIRENPLSSFLNLAFTKNDFSSEGLRFNESYYLYFRAMERALMQISTAVRYRKGPYYVYRYGGKFSPGQKKLADKARSLRPFMELDILTAVLFARILLDMTVGLARKFLSGPRLPSFTSFHNHKKFFLKSPNALPEHIEYSKYMCNNTGWFDSPLKYIRDKFVVHSGSRHSKVFTIGWEKDDDMLLNVFYNESDKIQYKRLSIWQLSYDIQSYLEWFATYGTKELQK